jgi:hypothetical protein
MRATITAIGLLLAFATVRMTASRSADPAPDAAAGPLEHRFGAEVRPFVRTYCLDCHGKEKPKGDLDLSSYATLESVAGDLPVWSAVMEQLESGAMPPAKAKRKPTQELRGGVVDWIKSVRKLEAKRHAGDPGPVPARRLSNAEYDHTVRDLTGADIRPTREFPVDPANEAGFDNSAESLSMSPALVKKYLEAARRVAEHVVLMPPPQGLAFASHPVVADTDRDKFSVRRIIDFYRRQPTDYADYFLAAWRFQHREDLGQPKATLAEVAAASRVSPKYLATVWSFLNEPSGEAGPVAAVQSLWRQLPVPDAKHPDAARDACERLRDFVVELRRKLTPEVPNLTVSGMNNGAQPLVLWKNRQYVANRRRYAGNAAPVKRDDFSTGTAEARALALPADPGPCVPDFERFCATFPDAFYVSERARVYLDPKHDKGNSGRLLSAGFHSMTGYFRDDTPLAELILDDQERRELDRLWLEFDVVTGAPARQYSSFLWFERTDSRFMRDPVFDFARAEDKDAALEANIRKLAEVYLAKALRNGASETAQTAITDHFEIISASLRRVERTRREAEPGHVEAVKAFAERAYRRPLSKAERDDLDAYYRSLREVDGLSHEDAVRDLIASVLMSPHFCYRVDLTGEGTGVRPLSDYALASRLSYFLWSSMPDEELLKRAAAGDLHRPDVIAAQARRMLRDDRVHGLATEFGGNWLDVRRFEEHNSVDRERFKTFDDNLRRAMFEEPVRFLVDVFQNDRPVLDLLDADRTFVNPALARHYGMPVPPGGPDSWARVDGARRFGRGGLLPMAVFLTKNAPGLRTSPVKRGYWVVRRLLGENIPPPPAQVPELPSDEAKLGDLTLRQALARHRADQACAGCHDRFDTIGLAFEGYGPVGELRTFDLGGRPVDTRATFPGAGGVEGTGVDGLRDYLDRNRRGEFVDNLCRKLLAYALGRSLLPSDDDTIDTMRARLAADDHRFGRMVEAVVTSPQFLNKRFDSEQAEE